MQRLSEARRPANEFAANKYTKSASADYVSSALRRPGFNRLSLQQTVIHDKSLGHSAAWLYE